MRGAVRPKSIECSSTSFHIWWVGFSSRYLLQNSENIVCSRFSSGLERPAKMCQVLKSTWNLPPITKWQHRKSPCVTNTLGFVNGCQRDGKCQLILVRQRMEVPLTMTLGAFGQLQEPFAFCGCLFTYVLHHCTRTSYGRSAGPWPRHGRMHRGSKEKKGD